MNSGIPMERELMTFKTYHTHTNTLFEIPETAEMTPSTRDIFLGTRGYCKCPAERRAAVCVI